MFKKLILVQVILLSFQTLLYFGCELFQMVRLCKDNIEVLKDSSQ